MTNFTKDTLSLYAMRSGETGDLYKIGVSRNVDRRAKQLQIGCPYPIRLVWHCYFTGDTEAEMAQRAVETEAIFHEYLTHVMGAHVRGEWFTLSILEGKERIDFDDLLDDALAWWRSRE